MIEMSVSENNFIFNGKEIISDKNHFVLIVDNIVKGYLEFDMENYELKDIKFTDDYKDFVYYDSLIRAVLNYFLIKGVFKCCFSKDKFNLFIGCYKEYSLFSEDKELSIINFFNLGCGSQCEKML